MSNITLSIPEDLLKAGREYAHKHDLSLNAFIRDILSQKISQKHANWLEECFKLMDQTKGNSKGQKWKRGDLYRV